MKITIALSYFSKETGLPEYYIARELAKLGHEVSIVASNRPYPSSLASKNKVYPAGITEMDGFTVYTMPLRFQAGDWAFFGKDYAETLRRLRPDIVHPHEFHTYSAYLCSRFGKETSTPVVLTQHVYHPPQTWYFRPIFSGWMAARGRKTISETDHFIALTEAQAKHLKSWGVAAGKITIIPSGVDTELFQPGKTAKPGEKMVIYVGSFSDRKIGLYLPAVDAICREGTDWKFAFVGKGVLEPRIDELKRRYPKNIENCGRVLREKVPEAMHRADIFVLASREEIFGLSAVEAQAAGLPAVVTAEGGLQTIVEHKKTGFVVEKNSKAVANAMKALMADENLRKKMAAAARKRAVLNYSWTTIAKRTVEVYEKLLADAQ